MGLQRGVRRALAVALLAGLAAPAALLGVWRISPPAVTPFMVLRGCAEGVGIDYRWRDLSVMSPEVVRAVIAAEDARFLQHHGFDWAEMLAAWRESRRGRRLRGASTISMQCARTLFLWPGRGLVRKVVEGYLTVLLELLWPKRRILETYLNTVEWGQGIYGCEAAAQHYFGIACAHIDAEQAARLAAVLPSPRRWLPNRPGPYVRRRADVIRRRMREVQVPPR